MKLITKIIFIISLLVLFIPKQSILGETKNSDDYFAGQEWYDLVETVEVNRELPHAYFIPYQNEQLALSNEQSIFTKDIFKSDYLINLNGEWDFHFAKTPYEQLSWDNSENWDTKDWDKIKVPSNVQLQFDNTGFKYDKPIYINMLYPWTNYEEVKLSEYPKAPTVNNGVSHYKRKFTIDKDWNNRQVFINFDGIGSAFYVFVNGVKVGYSEDSYTTHQFNITKYLNKDALGNISNIENTIAIQLYRYSDGSYLENQDMIRLNGIFRDVYLISKSDVEIRDIFVTTKTEDITTLNLEASIRNLSNEKGGNYKVEAVLYNQEGDKVWNEPLIINYELKTFEKDTSKLAKDYGLMNTSNKTIENPILWSSEKPYLYRLLVNLYDDSNNIKETTCIRFGIRDIELKLLSNNKYQFTINDKPILIKGVNRHEFDSVQGSAINKDLIINELMLMKQNNINAIRTSHYPNNVITYQVADEIGLYIMDETNIEAHYGAVSDKIPSGYKAWIPSVLDRMINMVERDKNYTSIIMWSLGNESTYNEYPPLDDNYSMYAGSSWILKRDPSRLRTYERDNRNGKTREDSMVDVFSSQYYSIDQIKKHLKSNDKLPYIQSEYAHSMGNALGNLKEYWDLFRTNETAQGGFIWDFKDQAILMPISLNDPFTNNITMFYGYGGDFGERVSDLEFSGNGLLFADGSPSAKLVEVNKVYQSINFKLENLDKGTFKITNENLFTYLNEYNTSYKIINDNKVISEGVISDNCKPQSDITIQIPLDFKNINNGVYTSIIFESKLKNDTNYNASKNDVIAYEQITLYENKQKTYKSDSKFINVTEDENLISINGKNDDNDFNIIFNKNSGLIESYTLNNNVLFNNGPKLNYTRSPISNDSQYTFNTNEKSKYAIELYDTQQAYVINKTEVTKNDNDIKIAINGKLNLSNDIIKIDYTIHSDGTISVFNEFKPSHKLSGIIPKVGMEFILNKDFELVSYYGKGPYENYTDRNSGSNKSIYETNANDMFEYKYLRPQDNGNRTNVSYFKVSNDKDLGILITGDNLQVSYLPYNHKQLNKAKHPYELLDSEYYYLNINGAVRGLGNAICGDLPLDKYTVESLGKVGYSYRIIPFDKALSEQECIQMSLFK